MFTVTDKVRINDSELLAKRNSHEIKLTVWVSFFNSWPFLEKQFPGASERFSRILWNDSLQDEIIKKN